MLCRRVLCDMSTVLHHTPAALQLLSDRDLFKGQLLGLMADMQVRGGFVHLGFCRVLGGEVLRVWGLGGMQQKKCASVVGVWAAAV